MTPTLAIATDAACGGRSAPLSIAAGVDAGKRFLDVGFAPSGKTFRVSNATAGIADLLARLAREGVRRVVLEAIGPYADRLVQALAGAGFDVGIVNPKRIKSFREAEGKRAKTDKLDARLIARFALVMSDALRPLPTAEQRARRALSVRRRQLTAMIAKEKTRLKQACEPLLLASHRAAIAALGEECRAIEAELARRVAADPDLAAAARVLVSIPGIGARIATLVLTELPEIGHRNRKTIAALVGLAPQEVQSGDKPPRAAIAGGRPCVRAAFYMAALVAVRHDPRLKALYKAMRADGKAPKLALIAVGRHILVLANALVKTNKPYDPGFAAKARPSPEPRPDP